MQYGEHPEHLSWFLRLATLVLVVAVLRLGEEVLLPIAFAGLLAFLLSPLVVRLTRWALPKAVAIIATVTIAFAVIGTVGWLVSSQAISLVRQLPNYEENLHHKITALKQPHRPALVSRIAEMAENLQRDFKSPSPERATPPPATPAEPHPIPVEVKATESTPWEMARSLAPPVLRPIGVAGIIIVFVVAMLFQREDLRDRVLKLISAGQLNVATQALDDAASRVSRYLTMQLAVNTGYGVPIGVGLYFIGIPNALLWGLLAMLLRFIPFLGPWIAASFPLTLAIAVDPGWTKVFYVFGIFALMEIISSNIIEILVYGATTGVSNLALLVAAVFWTWLWGPAGLVLSTPLTVCLLVLGKYVPGLGFLRMLLGSEPVLEPPAQFYQRMLSLESEDLLGLALTHVKERSLDEFYDDVFLPALLLCEQDRHRGTMPELRQQSLFETGRELIDELERATDTADKAVAAENTQSGPEAALQPESPRVLVLPARAEADEIVARMLCYLLRRRGVAAATQALTAPIEGTLAVVDQHAIEVLVVSALPPSVIGSARQLGQRLRERFSAVPLIVAIWRHQISAAELQGRLKQVHPEAIVGSLAQAMEAVEKALPPGAMKPLPRASERTAADQGKAPKLKATAAAG